MTDFWFKPKTHGIGATPTNWKGWAATLGYIAVMVALSLFLLVPPPGKQVGAPHAFLWLGLVMAVTYVFLRFSQARTEGEWRWRWGNKQ